MEELEKYPSKIGKNIYSPMRRLFHLTSSIKKRLKRNSFEKRANKKNISSEIIKSNNENIINKNISMKNMNQQKKGNQSSIGTVDNNMYNYLKNNFKSTIFNTCNDNFINNNNNNNVIQLQNNIININNNQYNYKKNIINNETNTNLNNKRKILSPSYKSFNINSNQKKKEKNLKLKKSHINNKNIYTSKGVFKYKINKNKEFNNYNINYSNNNTRNKNKEYKNTIPELEMPYSSRYFFSSRKNVQVNHVPKRNNNKIKNKTNQAKTIDINLENKKNKIKDIEINYRNSNKLNNINNNKINAITEEIKHNSTLTNFSNNNINNIDKDTNLNKNINCNKFIINTNLLSLLDNNIYSPKKCLNRIHSQENVYNNYNKIILNTENSKTIWHNKNKSVKDLTGFTYKKKNSSYKMNKKENSYDEMLFNLKPDIYPEIKINLKNKRKVMNKNNSVIYEKSNKNDLFMDNSNSNISKNNSSYIYVKNKIKGRESVLSSYPNILKNLKINKTFYNNNNNNTFFDIDTNEYILQENINEEEEISSSISYLELNYIIILLEKIKDIFDSLLSKENKNFTIKYCFEFINFIYNYNIDNYISNAIINLIDVESRKIFNNYILFSIVVIYDLISKENELFNNLKILIKENIKLIYTNIIIIINYARNNIVSQNNMFLDKIVDNMNSKYKSNKELYIDDDEYLLIKKNFNSKLSPEDKLNYNLNFIIKNLHTIINNIKKSENYNVFMQIFKNINKISLENIYDLYMNNIYQINIINSTLTTSSKINTYKHTTIIPKKNIVSNKLYTLLISLDETLIYFKIDKKNKNKNNKGIIQLRPWLIEFFNEIKPFYEIIAFSNGDKKYTDLIINSIDKNKIFFDNKLYRDHCVIINNDFVKDINILGKDISKIVIVDNIIQNYRMNIENGINIKSFYGEVNDKILVELGKILVGIAKFGGDIRKGIKYYRDDIINKVSSNIYLNYYK